MTLLIKDKKMDDVDRFQLILSYFMQLIVIVGIFIFAVRSNWINMVACLGILFLTFLPAIVRRRYHVYFPLEIDFVVIGFIFAAIFLGEIHGYYTRFWWWDSVLHMGSGLLLGLTGFLLIYILNEEKKVHVKMKPGFVALFAFAFAVMMGGIWEIFEFSMDGFFGLNMQKSGLIDTMWDLIVDTAGALVIALLGYFYLKKGNSFIFDRIVHRFVKRNPQLFKMKIKKKK